MELKVKASEKAIKALENFMFDSKYEYQFIKCNDCSENDKIEETIADVREELEDKFAEAEENGKKVVGCRLNIEVITIDEDDTPFDALMEIVKRAYEANDIDMLAKISDLAQETLEDEEV